jgi:hypothetical protein
MISEKTVELNLTTELINWFSRITSSVHYALAPSHIAEGRLGFDTSIQSNGTAILFQYKRAYVSGSRWEWRINHTRRRDQHIRLMRLEALGFPVYYALPYFRSPADIAQYRRRLLQHTFWFRPSSILPPGGPGGHHKIIFEQIAGTWSVTSQELGRVQSPLELSNLEQALENQQNVKNLAELLKQFNDLMINGSGDPELGRDASASLGSSVFVRNLDI